MEASQAEAEDFFGPEGGEEPQASSGPNAPHPNAPDEPLDEPREPLPEGASEAGKRMAEEAAAKAAEAPQEGAGDGGPQEETEPAGEAPFEQQAREHGEQQAGASREPKTPERDYRMFNEVALTPQVLRALLKEVEDGSGGEPRIAYFELPLVRDRTIKGAIAKTYKDHRETIGEKPAIAICPDRNWSVKHPRPRTRPVREAIEID